MWAGIEPLTAENGNGTVLPGGRELRARVLAALAEDDWEARLRPLSGVPPEKLVAAYFAALNDPAPLVRWRAVSAFGRNTASIAARDPEKARVVIRRCMWNLNDESGGIGWGVPEAMGESLALKRELADEFHSILLSYVIQGDDDAGNHLEFAPLRKGAWWAIARLAGERPELVHPALNYLLAQAALEEEPEIIAYACRLFGLLGDPAAVPFLRKHLENAHTIELYVNGELESVKTGAIAREALESCFGV